MLWAKLWTTLSCFCTVSRKRTKNQVTLASSQQLYHHHYWRRRLFVWTHSRSFTSLVWYAETYFSIVRYLSQPTAALKPRTHISNRKR